LPLLLLIAFRHSAKVKVKATTGKTKVRVKLTVATNQRAA